MLYCFESVRNLVREIREEKVSVRNLQKISKRTWLRFWCVETRIKVRKLYDAEKL